MDLFDKFVAVDEPLLHISRATHGIATYPKLDGPVGAHMRWHDREQIVWSINNYLGIANLPEVREADVEFARLYGFARPMGPRMMCGETDILEQLEEELANYVKKPAALFLNYGYQGMASLIDSLTTSSDWIVLDSQCHACIIDGVRLKKKGGLDQTRTFSHKNIDELQACLAEIDRVRSADAGVLVITEGVFGMSGDQGALREIVELKKTYDFRLLVDDAHGFGALGATGSGAGEEQGVQDGIDLYFSTFAKAAADTGAFVASEANVIWKLRYTMRSQIFSRGLPLPIIAGNLFRFELLRTRHDLRQRAHAIAHELQTSLTDKGFYIGNTQSLVTPVFLQMDPLLTLEFVNRMRHEHNVFCSGVMYPVVPPGVVQLRLVSTASHDTADVEPTVNAIASLYDELVPNRDRDLSPAPELGAV